MHNHTLIRLIRFVSQFTVYLCNTIYFSTIFNTPCKLFTKILFCLYSSKYGLKKETAWLATSTCGPAGQTQRDELHRVRVYTDKLLYHIIFSRIYNNYVRMVGPRPSLQACVRCCYCELIFTINNYQPLCQLCRPWSPVRTRGVMDWFFLFAITQ